MILTHTETTVQAYTNKDNTILCKTGQCACEKYVNFDWQDCWHGERQMDVKSPMCSFLVLAV